METKLGGAPFSCVALADEIPDIAVKTATIAIAGAVMNSDSRTMGEAEVTKGVSRMLRRLTSTRQEFFDDVPAAHSYSTSLRESLVAPHLKNLRAEFAVAHAGADSHFWPGLLLLCG
jgi:hypothetical protein